MPRKGVNEWLNGAKQEYQDGLLLWLSLKEHSKQPWLETLLKNGPCPLSTERLYEEMLFLNGDDVPEDRPLDQHPLKKRLELGDHSGSPERIKAARKEFKEIMTRINILRTEIRMSEGIKDRRWRAHRADKIVQLTRERRVLLDLFKVYDYTGEVPNVDMVIMLREDVQKMIQEYHNHLGYLSDNKKKAGKKLECQLRQARVNEIKEFLNT